MFKYILICIILIFSFPTEATHGLCPDPSQCGESSDDIDHDGINSFTDNCPEIYNPTQCGTGYPDDPNTPVPLGASCFFDWDGNGIIDENDADYLILAMHYPVPWPKLWHDVNCDGQLTSADISIFLSYCGNPDAFRPPESYGNIVTQERLQCIDIVSMDAGFPMSALPEPPIYTAFLLGFLLLIVLVRWRKIND